MASELCMNCFSVKGKFEVCPYCGYVEGTEPEQAFQLAPGTKLSNRYIVGTVLGMGGFGITYKAYDTILGVIVAIKEFYPNGLVNRAYGDTHVGIMSGEKVAEFNRQLQRFLLEAQSIAQFGKAKDIVNVYDYFEENGTAYIIMEYIDGVLLQDYMLQEGQLSVETALFFTESIIEALKKIHGAGIIHRDISPDNIFITANGSLKVFDFGAARFAGDPDETASAAVIKSGYAPPEQYRTKSKQGAFSDIYAVGAIMYQMITGVKPMEASDRVEKDLMIRPSQMGVNLDPNLDRAIMQAMAVRPELRFQHIEELQDAINDKLPAEYPEERLRKYRRKKRAAIVLSVTALCACVTMVILFLTVFKPANPVTESKLDKAKLTIWVPVKDDKDNYDDNIKQIVKKFQTDALHKDNKKVQIEVEAVPISEYSKRLSLVKGKNDMPDIFSTEYLTQSAESSSTPLKELYELLQDKNEYYFLSKVKEYYPEMKEIPMCIQQTFAYVHSKLDGKEVEVAKKKQIDISKDIMNQTALGENGDYCAWCSSQYVTSLYLMNNDWFSKNKIQYTPNLQKNVEILSKYQSSVNAKYGMEATQDYNNWLREGKLQMVIGDSSIRNMVKSATKGSYEILPLTKDGDAIYLLKDHFAINSKVSKNEKTASMRFLLYMLTDYAQDLNYVQNEAGGMPIRKETMKKYSKLNPKIPAIQKEEKSLVIAAYHLNFKRFNDDIKLKIIDQNNTDSASIEDVLKDNH